MATRLTAIDVEYRRLWLAVHKLAHCPSFASPYSRTYFLAALAGTREPRERDAIVKTNLRRFQRSARTR